MADYAAFIQLAGTFLIGVSLYFAARGITR